ncbi:MAG: exodeoxyribonuclease VII large subunit [Prevotella sp.]|nr:exodeoxyribonuclease VII large subunit [Prevotella sp.]
MSSSKKIVTLYELNRLVSKVIESEMPSEYWVEAELSECRESRGHCYMELIQKDERTATPIAKASAKCWANKWMLIRPGFERTTGQRLHAGMKVLLKVFAQFHEAYGFSWIVTDIDPTYTLGDMARKRQEIIRQLKEEGVFDLQKELQLPLFCQRIAVISSETAAGYGDFCNQLADNPYGFQFQTRLFPAIMQGEGVEQSIINALGRIFSEYSDDSEDSDIPFDCVVIIRGGGATSDMSGFDTLALAENVANFPLPIITGIGHDRDESILDMVSHIRVKTPTAAAALLIDHLKTVLDVINDAQEQIIRLAQQKLTSHKSRLSTFAEILPRLFTNVKTRQEARLDSLNSRMTTAIRQSIITQQSLINALEVKMPIILDRRLMAEQHRLQLIEEKTKSLDPALLLKRGYSITLHNGKAVRSPQQLQSGDEIETRLANGTLRSTVIK